MQRTALIVCARAALGAQKFGLAINFAGRLLATPLPPDADVGAAAKDIRTLLRDMQKRLTEVKRSNKRLARELSEWVTVAMEVSAAPDFGQLSLMGQRSSPSAMDMDDEPPPSQGWFGGWRRG